jgi:hypothetical protein
MRGLVSLVGRAVHCLHGCSFAHYGSGGDNPQFLVKADGKDRETGNETGRLIRGRICGGAGK